MKLLTASNPKLIKGLEYGYLSHILHLAPHTVSGYNVCPKASAGCSAACLNTAGRGRFDRTQEARIRKTQLFFENRDLFMRQLVYDIFAGIRNAKRRGLVPVFRLNGTSDIKWEKIPVHVLHDYKGVCTVVSGWNIMEAFPYIQFYDYTKQTNRANLPPNYHLTFSLSEENESDAKRMFDAGMNVAVVFHNRPETFWDRPVINGDLTDLRFLDPVRVIVGLKAKGKGKHDTSGFVK